MKTQVDKLKTLLIETRRKLNLQIQELKNRLHSSREINKRNGVLKREITQVLSSMSFYPHGSMSLGRSEWEEKWRNSEGKRILFYATKDYSGSFFKWAHAVNAHSDYAVRLMTSTKHAFGYQQDLIVPRVLLTKDYPAAHGDFVAAHDEALKLADEADVIHFKEEAEWFTETEDFLLWKLHKLAKKQKKPVVYTHFGGYARKYKQDKKYIDFVQGFDSRIAMTPDINYDWFDGVYIPHSIDTDVLPKTWTPGTRTLAHSPSNKSRKNTAAFEAAVEIALRSHSEWSYNRIHNVSYDECLALKQKCGLFFDQAGRENRDSLGIDDIIGWYGNSGIEGMVFGIPTIAHISEQAWQGAERAGKFIRNTCPILNTGITQDSFEKTVTSYLELTDAERCEISAKTRQWAVDFHSYQANAKELTEVYSKLLSKEKSWIPSA